MKKKVRSKLMSMALVFTMAAGLLSGCGGNNVAEADKNTITIWHDKEDAVAEVLQKKLEELEPDVHVVLEKKSDLTESLKMIGSDPKAAPDMYFFAHDKIGVYAEMGILAPITDIIPKEELNVYMDNTLEAATYKGEIYQLPVYYETLLFMYNRRYMKDDEVPKTTEELYQYTRDLLAFGTYTNKQVAEITGLGKNTVKAIDKQRLLEFYTIGGVKLIKPEKTTKYLGIDEFKLHDGKVFATHIIDIVSIENR